jgi:CrcB protein
MWEFLPVAGGGGFVGSIIRFGTGVLFSLSQINLTRFPVATLLVNMVGAFVIGFVNENFSRDGPWYYLLCLGFCGGLTTFSTFALEIKKMWSEKFRFEAVLYIIISIALGTTLAYAGSLIRLPATKPGIPGY